MLRLRPLLFAPFLVFGLGKLLAETPQAFPESEGIALDALKPAPAWAAEAVFYQIFPRVSATAIRRTIRRATGLETPIMAPDDWQISSWTADWYARD